MGESFAIGSVGSANNDSMTNNGGIINNYIKPAID